MHNCTFYIGQGTGHYNACITIPIYSNNNRRLPV